MGLTTCLGHEVDTFYNNLLEGRSGVSPIEGFAVDGWATRIAAEIKDFQCQGFVSKKMERRLDKCIKYTMVSGKKALQDAGLPADGPELKDINKARCGILIGSAMGGLQTFAQAVEDLDFKGLRKMNPFCIPFAITNMSSALLAMDLGFMGPNYSISTACATGNFCIQTAAEHIWRGDADLMLAGGTDAAIIPSGVAGFISCKALSKRNEDPTRASRPWDRQRDGFIIGEGAGALCLESLEHAQARGAPILAEYIGGYFTCDAHHISEPLPSGKGVSMCIERALQHAGVMPDEVNYINAHGTSTPAGDMAEYHAITNALPGKNLRINSTKSMIGHLLGAAGAVEAIATVQAIRTGWVHPNLNLEDPEDGVDTNILVGPEKQQLDIDVALSNSFGFGGHNSSILFRAFK
eukprot:jgi/Astpho2/368/Aster-02242